jgi:hypothetical protein
MEALVMKINGRWWHFPGDAINTNLWELNFRQGVPYLHECTGNLVRGIEVEGVEIGRPKPLTPTSVTRCMCPVCEAPLDQSRFCFGCKRAYSNEKANASAEPAHGADSTQTSDKEKIA